VPLLRAHVRLWQTLASEQTATKTARESRALKLQNGGLAGGSKVLGLPQPQAAAACRHSGLAWMDLILALLLAGWAAERLLEVGWLLDCWLDVGCLWCGEQWMHCEHVSATKRRRERERGKSET